jgi:hypothetical protein
MSDYAANFILANLESYTTMSFKEMSYIAKKV